MEGIDIYSDYFSFRTQLIDKHGVFYGEQSDIFFERAIFLEKKGLTLSAISDAKFALSLGQYQPENYSIIYLIGFLSQIHLDNNMIREAKSYCELGFKLLDKDDPDYDVDYKSFSELKEMIKGDEWKTSIN